MIPDSVKEIGVGAFSGCVFLSDITLPDSLVKIGPSAFQQCDSLTKISVPHGVERIIAWTFFDCYHLKSVQISDGVRTIEESAFGNCRSLEVVELPPSVERVDMFAFTGSGLKTLVVRNPNLVIHKKFISYPEWWMNRNPPKPEYTIYAPEGSPVSKLFPSHTRPLQEYDSKTN